MTKRLSINNAISNPPLLHKRVRGVRSKNEGQRANNEKLRYESRWLFDHSIYKLFTLLLILVLVPSSGCSVFNFGSDEEKKLDAETSSGDKTETGSNADSPTSKKVRFDGAGLVIGEADSLAYTSESFLKTISSLQAEKQFGSIKNLIHKYPDIALKTLQESDPKTQDRLALHALAISFDAKWCNSNVWQKYLEDLAVGSGKPPRHLRIRNQFWEHLQNDESDKALKLQLTKSLQRNHGKMIRADFYRLDAIAALMDGRHKRSTDSLEKAISLVSASCPYFTTKLQLLLGEFYRHAGRIDQWRVTWESAVVENSRVVVEQDSLDPTFWTRAAFLRPAGQGWPNESTENLRSFIAGQGVISGNSRQLNLTGPDSVLWLAIGLEHLQRAEGQNAVLAFKKAEAVETDKLTIANLHLFQARAIIAAGQLGPASAILFRIISEYDKQPIADRAKAILGAMKLQNGGVAQGINLLQSAIKTVEGWPRDERMRAQADYGLALLIGGREQEGLQLLSQVGSEFESIGDFDQAQQCLWNQAKYFEKTGQSNRHHSATAELSALEQRMK